MADQLLPGLDLQFLPREQREETVAEMPSRLIFVERGLAKFFLLQDGLPQEGQELTIQDALFVLQIKSVELRSGWYNVDTQEFLGPHIPEAFLEPK